VNTDESELVLYRAERRVREIQTKLHRWARDDPHRRFDDLFNLIADPAFLLVAWDRVRGNKGAHTAEVDGATASSIAATGVEVLLDELRSQVKDRSFRPLPVRERVIPKAGGKLRRLGIATVISYCPSCNRVSGFSYWSCCAVERLSAMVPGGTEFVIRFGCRVWCVGLRG
jgi:RNA-directed DNA polymerase